MDGKWAFWVKVGFSVHVVDCVLVVCFPWARREWFHSLITVLSGRVIEGFSFLSFMFLLGRYHGFERDKGKKKEEWDIEVN